jgi:epsin
MIYHRFTEKTAEQWRQIYKALQLLEFLIKNGSERVIDDARAHTSLLKMLRQFHFIDANGKDQGINVRNRSKELADLLTDVDKIRTERKKAKGNRAKYGGYEGGGGGGGGGSGAASSSSGRYGGFGSESAGYGAYDGRVYGDGGGFGGQSSDYQDTQARRDQFEEYDEFEEATPGKSRRKASTSSPTSKRESKKPETKAKVPEEDLFDFGEEPLAAPSTSKASGSALGSLQPADDEDDFDDFQSAPQPSAVPPPISAGTTSSFPAPLGAFSTMSLSTGSTLASPTAGSILSPGLSPAPARAPQQPTTYQPAQPNYFTSVHTSAAQAAPTTAARPAVSTTPGGLGKPIGSSAAAKPAAAGGDAFAGLLAGTSAKKDAGAGGAKLTMADLARQKTSAGIWGSNAAAGSAPAAAPKGQQKTGGGFDDLLGL